MLETIRAYAVERLEESDEAGAYRRRHAAYLRDLVERATPELRTSAQIGWIERLAAERDDFAAALRWALDERDAELALRLCTKLNWYWWMRGYRRESASWAAQVLELAGDLPPPGLAGAYAACVFVCAVDRLGELSDDRDGLIELWERTERLVEVARREGPVHPLVLLSRAVTAAMAGLDERATELLDAYAAGDDLWLASSALMIGGPGRSEEKLERAVAGFRKLGDRWGLNKALERYRSLFAVLPEVVPVVPFTVMLHTSYGRALALSGDVDAAMEQHRVALDGLGRRNQDRPLLSMVLAGFGLAEQARGDQERAAVLFGASAAVEPPDDLPETVEVRGSGSAAGAWGFAVGMRGFPVRTGDLRSRFGTLRSG